MRVRVDFERKRQSEIQSTTETNSALFGIVNSKSHDLMTWDEILLENYRAFSSPEDVRLGDSHILKAHGIGTVRIKTRLGNK